MKGDNFLLEIAFLVSLYGLMFAVFAGYGAEQTTLEYAAVFGGLVLFWFLFPYLFVLLAFYLANKEK